MNISLENEGTINKNLVTVGPLEIWFSYETPVAFSLNHGYKVVRENEWGPTTGKFLNELQPDRKLRISGEEFEAQLEAITSKLTLNA